MNVRSMFVLAAGFGLIVGAVPIHAHHSFAAEYDSHKPITITGTVTKVECQDRDAQRRAPGVRGIVVRHRPGARRRPNPVEGWGNFTR